MLAPSNRDNPFTMVQGVAEIAVQYDALEARLDALESECEALSRAIIKSGWSWSNVSFRQVTVAEG